MKFDPVRCNLVWVPGMNKDSKIPELRNSRGIARNKFDGSRVAGNQLVIVEYDKRRSTPKPAQNITIYVPTKLIYIAT